MEKFEPGDIVYSLSSGRGPDDMTWTVIGYIGDACYIYANPHPKYPHIAGGIAKRKEDQKQHPHCLEVLETWAVTNWREMLRLKVPFIQMVRDAVAGAEISP